MLSKLILAFPKRYLPRFPGIGGVHVGAELLIRHVVFGINTDGGIFQSVHAVALGYVLFVRNEAP